MAVSTAPKNTHNGVGEGNHQVSKPGFTLEEGHGAAHQIHTGHQSHKAQADGTDALSLLILAHVQHNAYDANERCQGRGFEQLDQEAVAFQAGQVEDPCRDRGANIGTHDNAHGLLQCHNTGVHETDHHDRGCGRRLDHSGDAKTKQESLKHIGTHLCQNGLQLAAGLPFQRFAHHIHAEQEQGKAAQQGDDFENISCHIFLLFG